LLDKTDRKIKLEEAKFQAAKVPAHATLLQAMNEASQHTLTKMKEDSKILMADTSMMDDDAKTWYKMARHHSREEGGGAAATGGVGATTASHSSSTMAISISTATAATHDGSQPSTIGDR
jgi:hypothetical protein